MAGSFLLGWAPLVAACVGAGHLGCSGTAGWEDPGGNLPNVAPGKGGGGEAGASSSNIFFLGAHGGRSRAALAEGLNATNHEGEVIGHMILDCEHIDSWSGAVADTVATAHERGYTTAVYRAVPECIYRIYQMIDDRLAEDGPGIHQHLDIFAVERSGPGNHALHAMHQIADVAPVADPERSYLAQKVHILREWLGGSEERRRLYEAPGGGADEGALFRTTGIGGDLQEVAKRVMQTNMATISWQIQPAPAPAALTSTQGTVILYTATVESSPQYSKPQTFFLIASDWILSNSAAYQYKILEDQDAPDDGYKVQGWYLSSFKNSARLYEPGATRDEDTAFPWTRCKLLDHSPPTVAQAEISTSFSVGFEVGVNAEINQADGRVGSLNAARSWSTSTNIAKADVGIDNMSLATPPLNGAEWGYLPRAPEKLEDGCVDSMHNLAQLAVTTFQPGEAMIFRVINPQELKPAVLLKSSISLRYSGSYMSDPNAWGCNMDITSKHFSPTDTTFSIPIHMPLPSSR